MQISGGADKTLVYTARTNFKNGADDWSCGSISKG